MPATFGYWKLRGLGQAIRLILEYTGADYKEKRYEIGPAPDFASEWPEEKFNLGMDLPNLPYYFDGNFKITQSNAILRFIARKNDLIGNTEEEIVKLDMLENFAMDMRLDWAKCVYNKDFESLKEKYISETIPKYLDLLSKFIGSHKWFTGEKLSFVDFLLYEHMDVNRTLAPSCLDDYQNLQDFMTRFEALPPIKAYMNSPKFMKTPLNGPMAPYGGK